MSSRDTPDDILALVVRITRHLLAETRRRFSALRQMTWRKLQVECVLHDLAKYKLHFPALYTYVYNTQEYRTKYVNVTVKWQRIK